jgi:anti-anti-sigma factor
VAHAPLRIKREGSDGARVLAPEGEIHLGTAPVLGAALREELAGAPHLIVDLSDVEHLDSTGLAVLLNAGRRLTRAGGRLSVVSPGGPPRRILETTGLLDTLNVASSRAAALERAR